MSPQSIQAFWNNKLNVHLAVQPDKQSWEQAVGLSVDVAGSCRGHSSKHVWTTTRQTLTQGRASFKNNCNIDVTRQIVRYIRALMRWRRTALGVTVSLPNTSLTGSLAINSTRPSRCATWGPQQWAQQSLTEKKPAVQQKKMQHAGEATDAIQFCFVKCWAEETHAMSPGGETIVSGWISAWCTAASCRGRRRIAGKKRRYEWTLEKEMRPKRQKKLSTRSQTMGAFAHHIGMNLLL